MIDLSIRFLEMAARDYVDNSDKGSEALQYAAISFAKEVMEMAMKEGIVGVGDDLSAVALPADERVFTRGHEEMSPAIEQAMKDKYSRPIKKEPTVAERAEMLFQEIKKDGI